MFPFLLCSFVINDGNFLSETVCYEEHTTVIACSNESPAPIRYDIPDPRAGRFLFTTNDSIIHTGNYAYKEVIFLDGRAIANIFYTNPEHSDSFEPLENCNITFTENLR